MSRSGPRRKKAVPLSPLPLDYVQGGVARRLSPKFIQQNSKPMLTNSLPDVGVETRQAIEAAEAILGDGAWHPWTEVVDAMTAASNLQPKSASNRIHELVKAGNLERRGQHPNREVRLP